ncbi:unnamed protein product [Polarella glacialis]|uniref:Uncharacterized protein n=1 Tax=Polarella glacialis TaxID=89957 RepID=A0A813KLU6_POLGL|nr:unnamed protein product [Polarella glacialis]
MAQRVRLSIAAGLRESYSLPWSDPQEEGHQDPRLGSVEWSIVVLDDLTIDLEVSAQLDVIGAGDLGLVTLSESRGKTFRGVFEPSTDARLLDAEGGSAGSAGNVKSIVFNFSNEFSWFSGKEVELVFVQVRPPGQPLSKVPPLLPLQPLVPLLRAANTTAEGPLALALALPELQRPPARSEAAEIGAEGELRRFVSHLDCVLDQAESNFPDGDCGPWLKELRRRIAALRGLCKQGPPVAPAAPLAVPPAAAAERAAPTAGPGARTRRPLRPKGSVPRPKAGVQVLEGLESDSGDESDAGSRAEAVRKASGDDESDD